MDRRSVTLIRLAGSQVYFNRYDIIIFLTSKREDSLTHD